MRRLCTIVVGLVLVACGTDGGTAGTAEVPTGGDTETATVGDGDVAPSGMVLVDGLPVIDLLGPAESDAGEAPLFRWEPIDGAVQYSLAVRGPDGPLWAWRGADSQIYLGGLPFERPPGWAGPVIVAGSCWSVVALDASGHVMAVSELLPVSPGESPGHSCVPGQGGEPGG